MNPRHMEVVRLRKEGFSYGVIAEATGLSINTVITICRRNGIKLKDIGQVVSKRENDLSYCKYCHQPFTNPWHRKTKLFCSSACHDKWWNELRKKAAREELEKEKRLHEKLPETDILGEAADKTTEESTEEGAT